MFNTVRKKTMCVGKRRQNVNIYQEIHGGFPSHIMILARICEGLLFGVVNQASLVM
jgi:hypothetical protein